ncbi:MAG TPA: hypothetical protein VEK07_19260 [Polyangiaceae bacterium]|nr:hypothetical protein [Polyangiaceae bacterium]
MGRFHLAFANKAFAPLALLTLAGCGGGLPLLHPARALPQSSVRAFAGFSDNVAAASFSSALRAAINDAAANPGAPGAPGSDPTYARGALVAASVAPGLAPVAGARVGLGEQFEAGLAYTGRAIRGDVRRSFDLGHHWTLGAGVGGSAALFGDAQGTTLPNVDLGALHGWGADVPVQLGYESDGGLYMAWIGARAGWEHVDIGALASQPGGSLGAPPISLSATRFWTGGLVGVAVGFWHVHVAVELDVSYASVEGDYNETHASVEGATLAPAAALWWRF